MRRATITKVLLIVLLIAGPLAISSAVQLEQEPAPTLVPPTPIPRDETGEDEVLPSQSVIARIQENGIVRVGILYNAPPFGELNIQGEVTGYDADLARRIAEVWDVEIEFVQARRDVDSWVRMLREGQVDMLLAAQVHRRELAARVEFSQTYYLGRQAVMIRAEDEAETLAAMSGRRLGVVVATPAEEAVRNWLRRNELSNPVQTYYTLDRAYVALVEGEIDGVVDSAYRLRQVSLERPDLTRILEEPLEMEPFGVAVVRQDANMRDLVNHTLQYLAATEQLDEVHQTYFPGQEYQGVRVWANLPEEAPAPAQYSTDLLFPPEYVVPRLQTSGQIRVAGLLGVTADSDATESERRLDAFHRTLLQEMASRWNVTIEFIPDSHNNAAELLANGQADIAVGLAPDWNLAGQIDFSGIYLLHGERLMIREGDSITGFGSLGGGRIVVTPNNEATAAQRAVEIAETANARIEIEQMRESDLGFALLSDEDLDASAVFGDSLKLVPHVLANPGELILTEDDTGRPRWYSRSYMALGVPRNDIDFRMLVEYTLQELVRDGTLQSLLQPLMLPDEMPTFEIWPGSTTYLNFSLAR